jgi:hypothetical protein
MLPVPRTSAFRQPYYEGIGMTEPARFLDPPDTHGAMMLLLQRLSDTQIDQGRAQVKQTEDQHDIKLALATLSAELKPLTTTAGDIHALSLTQHRHADRLEAHGLEIRTLRDTIAILHTASDKRHGWETLGGRILYVVGSVIVGILTVAVKQLGGQ